MRNKLSQDISQENEEINTNNLNNFSGTLASWESIPPDWSIQSGNYLRIIFLMRNKELDENFKEKALTKLQNLKDEWPISKQCDESTGCSTIEIEMAKQIKVKLIDLLLHSYHKRQIRRKIRKTLSEILKKQLQNCDSIDEIANRFDDKSTIFIGLETILAVCQAFELSYEPNLKQIFLQLSLQFQQLLYKVLTQIDSYSELDQFKIKYYITKILCAIFKYQSGEEIRALIEKWASIIVQIAGSHNPLYEQNYFMGLTHGAQIFYYFHSKKWALKIIKKMVSTFFKTPIKYRRPNYKQSDEMDYIWFDPYKKNILEIALHGLKIQTLKPIELLYLRIFDRYSIYQPDLIIQHVTILREELLPRFLALPEYKKKYYEKNCLEYFQEVQRPVIDQELRIASDVWTALLKAEIKVSQDPQTKIHEWFQFIKKCFSSELAREKEIGLLLLNNNRKSFMKYPSVIVKLNEGIQKYIMVLFDSEDILLEVYALEFFERYQDLSGFCTNSKIIYQKLIFLIQNNPFNLVKIKAVKAFSVLLANQQLSIIESEKHIILREMFYLIKQTLQLSIFETASKLVKILFEKGIQEHEKATEYLFVDFFHDLVQEIKSRNKKEQEGKFDEEDYFGIVEGASDFLQTVVLIMNSSGIKSIQRDIITISSLYFNYDELIINRQPQLLMSTYLHKIKRNSLTFFYFLPCILRKNYPFPNHLKNSVEKLSIGHQGGKKIFRQIKCAHSNGEYNKSIIRLIRIFFRSHFQGIKNNQEVISCLKSLYIYCMNFQLVHNTVHRPLLEVIIQDYIKIMPIEVLAGDASFFMVYTYKSSKSIKSTSYLMLYFLLLWKYGPYFLKTFSENKELSLDYVFFYIIKNLEFVKTAQHQKMLVLGLTQLFLVPKTSIAILKTCWKNIFSILINTLNKLCDKKYLATQIKQKKKPKSENLESSEMEEQLSESEEEESVENENYLIFSAEQSEEIHKKYSFEDFPATEYQKVDELRLYLNTLGEFKKKEPDFSQSSMNEIGATHIEKLTNKIEKTIQYLQENTKKTTQKLQQTIQWLAGDLI